MCPAMIESSAGPKKFVRHSVRTRRKLSRLRVDGARSGPVAACVGTMSSAAHTSENHYSEVECEERVSADCPDGGCGATTSGVRFLLQGDRRRRHKVEFSCWASTV